ncbi:MAG TPA: hypothetical protein VHH34_22805 [Pseudonocardiaceae bacterium]|nr:hypothetical protein [Pseudonocardiaceae bacterium]
MKFRGPVITLLAVAALAAALLVVNMRTVAETAARGTAPPVVPSGNAQSGNAQSGNAQSGNRPPGNDRPGNGQAPVVTEPPPPPPGPVPSTEPVNYAGRSSGNEATIAIAVEGEAVSAYVCDGAQVESWLDGTMKNGRLDLQGANGAKVTGAIQDGAVFGTMRVQGNQWPYSARAAEAPVGLYDGRGTVNGAPARVGWIVLQDGSQVGVADVGGDPGRPRLSTPAGSVASRWTEPSSFPGRSAAATTSSPHPPEEPVRPVLTRRTTDDGPA